MKKKIIIAAAAVLVLLIIAAAVAIGLKRGIFYRIGEFLERSLMSAEFEVADGIAMTEYDLHELIGDSRITFDQSGMLISTEHLLDDGFIPDISEYKDTGVMMNSAITAPYAELSAAVSELFGERLLVMSSFRTAEEQLAVIAEEGEKATAVGASEHQAGLSLDVYIKYHAGISFIGTKVGRFVNSDAWKYGFIIRYPSYGENETGIAYEPWHIRYVGAPHAEIIYKNSLTLEGYHKLLSDGKVRRSGDYLICRVAGDKLPLPDGFLSAVISPDNCGGYIVTAKMSATD